MKNIHNIEDLAVNGAPPAFNEHLYVGRPNIEKEAFTEYVEQIFSRKLLTNNGPLVQELEEKIARLHEVKHCVAVCNGTVALEIAIRALELDGEVIVPSFTFISTVHAIHRQGIIPVFADIDLRTHNLDPCAVQKMITSRTSGIIGVHLWGRPAPVKELQNIASDYGLKLAFDSAHAFGCSYKGLMIGSFGNCEVLSFHATKIFNTFEGGAVLTNDRELADAVRLIRNHGFSGMDNVIHSGTNGKMIEVAAAMGLANLGPLGDVIEVNRKNYYLYKEGLDGLPSISLIEYDETESNNYHYVVMEVHQDCPVTRDEIIRTLHAENIVARRYFWPGCHNMKPYRDLYPNVGMMLPNTQKVADNVVVLPTGTAMKGNMIKTVVSIIRVLLRNSK